MSESCPFCGAGPIKLEHLDHGYCLCNRCGRTTKREGRIVLVADTNHTPVMPETVPVPVIAE